MYSSIMRDKRLMKMLCMMKICKKNVIKDNLFGKIKIAVGHRGDNEDKQKLPK